MPVRARAAPPNEPPTARAAVESAPAVTPAASDSAPPPSQTLPLPPSAALSPPPEPLAPSPPPPDDPSVTRGTVALVAAGVAVASASVGTVFGVLALQNKSDYRNNPTYSDSDRGNNDAAYADGAIALAVAAAVTSIVLYVTSDANSDESPDRPFRKSARPASPLRPSSPHTEGVLAPSCAFEAR